MFLCIRMNDTCIVLFSKSLSFSSTNDSSFVEPDEDATFLMDSASYDFSFSSDIDYGLPLQAMSNRNLCGKRGKTRYVYFPLPHYVWRVALSRKVGCEETGWNGNGALNVINIGYRAKWKSRKQVRIKGPYQRFVNQNRDTSGPPKY